MLTLMVLNVFPALLAYAAAKDLFFMKIPNWISIGLICWFVIIVFSSGIELAIVANHVGAALLALFAAFVFFCFGWVGGGDAKLATAIALWVGFNPLLFEYWALSAVLGGILTLLIIGFRRRPLLLPPWGWALRLHERASGVPYGIALSGAGIILYQNTYLFGVILNKLS